MADSIVYRFDEMRRAADSINDIANNYKQMGTDFVTGFDQAISEWEGDSKIKLQSLIDNDVRTYLEETIPGILNGLAELLNANAEQMEKADREIADNIPDTITQ